MCFDITSHQKLLFRQKYLNNFSSCPHRHECPVLTSVFLDIVIYRNYCKYIFTTLCFTICCICPGCTIYIIMSNSQSCVLFISYILSAAVHFWSMVVISTKWHTNKTVYLYNSSQQNMPLTKQQLIATISHFFILFNIERTGP